MLLQSALQARGGAGAPVTVATPMNIALKELFSNIYVDKQQARYAAGYFLEKFPGATVDIRGLTVTVAMPLPMED